MGLDFGEVVHPIEEPMPHCVLPWPICSAFFLNPALVYFSLFLPPFLLYSATLSCYHSYLVLVNRTTNESINESKYRERLEEMDRDMGTGVIVNCKRFWCDGRRGRRVQDHEV